MTSALEAPDAVRLVGDGSVWLLDVREGWEWNAGHAGSAHHIPMGELQARQDELPSKGTIAVICHTGQRSRLVTDALLGAGYTTVNVDGGMDAWKLAGGDVAA
ncbi:rhodanese-like domain-containing protein [Glaciibacter superstes]|uniref:rhodanese-like domain-containing protein n=1 Tax=Glaciibacter superstes TaxID=501023 RepID=UPI0003B59C6E|nr:rhodanese-like domain-containing protein [Glaciibacter superstes]